MNDIIDIEPMIVVHSTEMAWQVTPLANLAKHRQGHHRGLTGGTWLPKSQCSIRKDGETIIVIGVSDWMIAKHKTVRMLED